MRKTIIPAAIAATVAALCVTAPSATAVQDPYLNAVVNDMRCTMGAYNQHVFMIGDSPHKIPPTTNPNLSSGTSFPTIDLGLQGRPKVVPALNSAIIRTVCIEEGLEVTEPQNNN